MNSFHVGLPSLFLNVYVGHGFLVRGPSRQKFSWRSKKKVSTGAKSKRLTCSLQTRSVSTKGLSKTVRSYFFREFIFHKFIRSIPVL
jgi:hypothetical protein